MVGREKKMMNSFGFLFISTVVFIFCVFFMSYFKYSSLRQISMINRVIKDINIENKKSNELKMMLTELKNQERVEFLAKQNLPNYGYTKPSQVINVESKY